MKPEREKNRKRLLKHRKETEACWRGGGGGWGNWVVGMKEGM